MTRLKLLSAAALLSALAVAPSLAQARTSPSTMSATTFTTGCPTKSATSTITGRGSLPGTFAYYDGPSTVHCAQSAATYLGQDRRRHPCN